MKLTVYISLAVCFLLAMFMVPRGTSQNLEDVDQAGKYSTLIDETIAKCTKKAELLNSRSPNIHRQAIRACLKGAYLKLHKQELVAYLIAVDADLSRDRVEYYLNKRFYQSLKPEALYVLLEASEMLKRSE